MSLVSFDLKWFVNKPATEAFISAHQLIESKEIRDLKLKKSVPHTYMLVKYGDREIQIGFEERVGYTLVSVKVYYKKEKERGKIEFALNELKWRLGAGEVKTTLPIFKDVKRKSCPYCRALIPLDAVFCPHCGGKLF